MSSKKIENIKAHKFRNEKDFAHFAQEIAKQVLTNGRNKNALVIGLIGELGAGKTTFSKYFLKKLGVKEEITSPTFLIMRPHRIDAAGFTVAYHFDWYRVEKEKEIADIGFQNIIDNPNHIVLIEWADKFPALLPAHTIWIELSHGKGKTERVLVYKK